MNREADAPPPAPPTPLWRREGRALHCAMTFLTRVPLPRCEWQEESLNRCSLYFPLVGLLVGLGGALAYTLASNLWSAPLALLLAMAAMLLLTGGFHEDGLADTADGFGGGWTVEDKLRIMKDSRLGTYGALALVMALLLKFTALASLPPAAVVPALLLGQVLGRWATLPLLRFSPYVRGEGGTGKPLVGGVSDARLALATAFTLLVVLALRADALLPLAIATALVILWWRRHCQRQIGGITWDALGAGNQLTELAVYLVLAALAQP